MKLYTRKLSGLEELKREKARLKIEQRYSKASDLMPVKEVGGESGFEGVLTGLGGGGGVLGTAMQLLTAKSNLQRVIIIGGPLLSLITRGRKKKEQHTDRNEKKSGFFLAGTENHKPAKAKSIAKRAASEFIGGYLKWKALEMSIRGVKLALKWRARRRDF